VRVPLGKVLAATVVVVSIASYSGWSRADDDTSFPQVQWPQAEIVAALSTAEPVRFRPIGTTSITFQLDLEGPIDAAFKPESRSHPRGWSNEVAAYRVARLLGLDDVPPAIARSVDRAQLRRRFDPDSDETFDDLAPDLTFTGNELRGAFLFWVLGMLHSDLDTPQGIRRWSAWLAIDGTIPEDQRSIARDLSNMVVFDYLIANRDRWSGGNVRPLESGRLIIRDHNLAFPPVLAETVHLRLLSYLRRVQRFSRTTMVRLLALDRETLRAALAEEGTPSLLDERQLEAVMQRREAILSYVGALIEAHGEASVLAFD
jgi:hypothetical protein